MLTRWKVEHRRVFNGEGVEIAFCSAMDGDKDAAQIVREHNSISKLQAFAQMIANGGLDSGVDHATIEAEAREALNA